MLNAKTLLLFALLHQKSLFLDNLITKHSTSGAVLKCMILCLLYNFCFSFDFKEMYGQHIKYSGEGGWGGGEVGSHWGQNL